MEQAEPDIWRDLAILLAVGESECSSAAARALGLSHDIVETRINQLETRYGSVLVERAGKRWRLTHAGHRLAQKARSIADLVDRKPAGFDTHPGAGETMPNADGRSDGFANPSVRVGAPIVIGCPELFFEHLLLPIWYRIQKDLPSQAIRLRTLASVTDLSLNGCDLNLCLTRTPNAGHAAANLGDVQFRLYAHRTLLAHTNATSAPSHFAVENGLFTVPDLMWPDMGRTRRVSCSNLSMVARAVLSGQGIGILPDFIAAGTPVLVPLDGVSIPPFTLLLSSGNTVEQSGAVQKLCHLLRRELVVLLNNRPDVLPKRRLQ